METERIKTAIEFLKDGQSFKVGDLRLGMDNKTNMYITGWSQYSNIESLTKKQALKELEEIKTIFKRMIDASQELNNFIRGKSLKYNLAFNYGMGAVDICSEKDGTIRWEMELK